MGVIKTFSEFIKESIWSDIQDRSAGKDVRKEDLILDNEDLRNKILELYKEQGEGDTLDVSSLTNLIRCNDFSNIFSGLKDVKHIIGLENWDVSKVTNMEEMFNGCEKFNADLSKWDVSSVEDMNSMFNGCKKFNSDLSNWNVSGVENMACMFSSCESFNANLSKWDVSNVVDMGAMFTGCKKFKSDLSKWDVSNVVDMGAMFNDCVNFNADLSKWNVSNAEHMGAMFSYCENFNADLSNWNISKVTSMGCMFTECKKFNSDLSKWDVSNVVDMSAMFKDCINFNADLSKWDVSKVTNMKEMFNGCKKFNSDLSNWNVSNVKDGEDMFNDCYSLKLIPSWHIRKFINIKESLWSEIQDRSAGKVIRKEDDINILDGTELVEYMKSVYILSRDNLSFIQNSILTSLFSIGGEYYSIIYQRILTDKPEITFPVCRESDIENKLSKIYKVTRLNQYNIYKIEPKDGSKITNKFFLEVFDFILDNVEDDKHINILIKKKITESLWSEIQDRSSGEILRKEDEIGNIKELESVDMGGTVFWADKDLCCYDEYHFGYSEVFEYIKKSEWRLPTLKEVEELDEYKVKTYDNSFVISGPSEDLIFIARGLVYSDKVKVITDDDFYYAWTSDLYNNHQAHILTFDDNKLIHSKIDSNNIMDQITNDISGKLCVRLVKDK